MPKRTNEFQQLIHYIYSQMVPQGATVTESSLLKERDSGSEREVDILIEHKIAGTKLRMAVECRDRSRRDSIEWIDSLIGKFKDLDVDKVVAVNRSGFAPTAIEKASANGIETRTFEKALDTNWLKEFFKLGIVKLTYQTRLVQARIDTDPPITGQVAPSDIIADSEENVLGTLSNIVTDCFEQRVQPEAHRYIHEHFFDLFETLADLKKKVLVWEQSFRAPSDYYLTDAVGAARKIRSLWLHALTVFSVNESVVKNHAFGEAQITSGSVEFEYSGAAYSLDIVQIPGKEHGKLFIRPGEKKEK